MKTTQLLIPTQKEAPNDAQIISHQLMIRAGLISKLASGLYSYLPMGVRILKKVENIIREEMDKAGSQFLADMAQIGIQINLLLAVLNLLPLPPLDGGRVVSALLPPKISYQFDQLEAYGLFILLGLLFLGIFQSVILPIVKFIQQWLYTLVGLI